MSSPLPLPLLQCPSVSAGLPLLVRAPEGRQYPCRISKTAPCKYSVTPDSSRSFVRVSIFFLLYSLPLITTDLHNYDANDCCHSPLFRICSPVENLSTPLRAGDS